MIIYMFSGIKRYCDLKLFRKQKEHDFEIFSGIKTESQNVHECLKYVMTYYYQRKIFHGNMQL